MQITTALRAIGVNFTVVHVNGTKYVVTTGTGEMSFGHPLGGSAAFAYLADDDSEDCEYPTDSYQSFCDAVFPVGEDDENWLTLAVALARMGMRLAISGTCAPALTDREYQIARINEAGIV